MNDIEMHNATDEELISHFSSREWSHSNIVEDDKYYDTSLLEDKFIVFYMYAFAYLDLPSPTKMQLEIALFISNKEHSHRLVWAQRRRF